MEVLVLVHVLEIEGLRGLAVAAGEEGEALGQKGLLLRLQGLPGRAAGGHLPQGEGVLAHELADVLVAPPGVAGLEGLGHGVLGHHAVLAHQAGEHIPLSAVGEAALEEEIDRAVVEGQACGLQDGLKEVVAALELVPEGHVALGQLEVLQVQLLGDVLPQDIGGGKEPAASGGLLVGGLHGLDVRGELEDHLPRVVGTADDLADVGCVQDAGHGLTHRVGAVALPEAGQVGRCDVAAHFLVPPNM